MKSSKSSEESRSITAAADMEAFELHLRQLYLYYEARRRRGRAVFVVSSAWACYNVSVWLRGWIETGILSWFLVLNTVGSVALAGACVRSTFRDSLIYVPQRYEDRSNGVLRLLGLWFAKRTLRRQDDIKS